MRQDDLTGKHKIITNHEYPPIPDRRFDWAAWWEGMDESGPFGRGRNEAEAIADLKDNYDEPGEK